MTKKKITQKRIRILIVLVAVSLAIGFYLFRVYKQIKPFEPLSELFQSIENQGYKPNYVLSGNLLPGAMIQLKDKVGSSDSIRTLKNPLMVFDTSVCYALGTPVVTAAPQLNLSGTESAKLDLDVKTALRYLPQFGTQSSAIKSFVIKIGTTKLWSYPKGELMTDMRVRCAKTLTKAISMGDELSWYHVIQDALVMDSFSMEVEWKDEPSASMLASISGKAKTKDAIALAVSSHTGRKTQLTCSQPLVLGYRSRPLAKVPDSQTLSEVFHNSDQKVEQDIALMGALAVMLIDQQGERRVQPDYEFTEGDLIRFLVQSKKSGWIYLFNRTGDGPNQLIWPKAASKQNDPLMNYIRTGAQLSIPGKANAFRFDDETGNEFFTLVISEKADFKSLTIGHNAQSAETSAAHSNFTSMYTVKGVEEVLIGEVEIPEGDGDEVYFASNLLTAPESVILEFRLVHK